MLLAVLQEEGFEVRVCVDPHRVVQRATAFQPHLVILDLVMPDLSGADLLKELRATPEVAETPILLVTAYPSAAERLEGQPLDRVAFLEKPFDVDALVERVQSMVGITA